MSADLSANLSTITSLDLPLHPFVTVTAALGSGRSRLRAAGLIVRDSRLSALGLTEAGQQTLTLTLFIAWHGLPQATQPPVKFCARRIAAMMRFGMRCSLTLLGFLVGTCSTVATIRERGLTRVLGFFYFARFSYCGRDLGRTKRTGVAAAWNVVVSTFSLPRACLSWRLALARE